MNEGKIEEIGDVDEIYVNFLKEYIKKFIEVIFKGI